MSDVVATPAAPETPAPPEAPHKPEVGWERSILFVDDVSVSFDGFLAIKHLSLTLEPGELRCIIGPNGAGKTTMLDVITGKTRPTSGRVYMHGQRIDLTSRSEVQIARLGIGRKFQRPTVFPTHSVLENLELGAYLKRERKGREERLARVLKLFPRLGERLTQDAGTLSGGEQQMLAIGRALMAEPRMILLDEPSLGLAPKLVSEIFAAIRAIAAEGMTILLVEQNTRLSLETATRAYVLATGEIALQGAASDLRHDRRIREAYLGGSVT